MKKITAISVLIIAAVLSYAIYKSYTKSDHFIQEEVREYGVRPADVISDPTDAGVEIKKDQETEVARLEFRDDALEQEEELSPVLETPLKEEEPKEPETEVARLEFHDDALEQEEELPPVMETPLEEEGLKEPETEVASIKFSDDALEQEEELSPVLETPLEEEETQEPETEVASVKFRDDALKKEEELPPVMETPLEEEGLKEPETEVASIKFSDDALEQEEELSPVLETPLEEEETQEPETEVASVKFRDDALKKEEELPPVMETPLEEEGLKEPETEVAGVKFRDDALKKEEELPPVMETPLEEEGLKEPETEVARPELPVGVLAKEIVPAPAIVAPLTRGKQLVPDIVTDSQEDIEEIADPGDVSTEQSVVEPTDKERLFSDRELDKKMDTETVVEEADEHVQKPDKLDMAETDEAEESLDVPDETTDDFIPEKTTAKESEIPAAVLPEDDLLGIIVAPAVVLPVPDHYKEIRVPKDETLDGGIEKPGGIPEKAVPMRSIEDLGESIAILPFDNLSKDDKALEYVMPVLRKHLEDKGFNLMYEEVLGDFLCEERVKRTGYISQPLARQGRDKLNIKAFVAGSVVTYSTGDDPRVGILARMVNATTGDILWADYVSMSGEDFTTLLGLGKISDISKLLHKAVDKLFGSLSVEHTDSGSGPAHRIAVMPFRNNSRYEGAGMIATYMFMVELFKNRQFDPTEFGDVRRIIVGDRIRDRGDLDYTNMKAFSDHLDTGAVIVGTVDYYSDGKNESLPPKVGITARLLDTKNKKILWYNTREVNGEEDIIAFDWGRIRTVDGVAYKVVSSLIEDMGDSKWKGFEENH